MSQVHTPHPQLPLFNTESSTHQVDSVASGLLRRLLKEPLETTPWGSKASFLCIWKERAASQVPDVSLLSQLRAPESPSLRAPGFTLSSPATSGAGDHGTI